MNDKKDTEHGSGKMSMQAQGIPASNASGTRVYLHADSETLLAVPGDIVEQESNRLNEILGYQIDSQMRIDDLTKKCTTLDWGQVTQRNRLQDELQREARRLDEFNQKLKIELSTLSPTEELPAATLLDEESKSAIGLMELIELGGGVKETKFIHIRSDKIRSHWQRYPLDDREKKTGEKSFIKKEEYTDGQGNRKKRDVIDYNKLKEQILKVKPNMLRAEQDIVEQHISTLGKWAEDMNESLRNSPYKGENIEFNAQSQLMRWTYGAGFTEEWNPFEIDFRSKKKKTKTEDNSSQDNLSGKISAYASLALAESKSKFVLSLPDNKGITLLYPLKPAMGGGVGTLGTLRFDFEIALSGSIGASLGVELGVSAKTNWAKGVPASSTSTEAPGNQTIDITKIIEEPEAKGELSVFAGAQASVNLSGAIMWQNPDQKLEYTTLAKVAVGASGQFGAGWSGALRFSYENGRVRVTVRGGMCWGSGGSGSLAFDVDGAAIMTEFMPCLTYMLRNADYIKLSESVIEEDDFYAFCALPLLIGMYGVNQLIDNLEKETNELIIRLENSWNEKELRVALMQDIIDNKGECLKYSPPESKGAAIASLIEHDFWDDNFSPSSHTQTRCEGQSIYSARKRAILLVLRWVQSKRDYENVMQHLSKDFSISGSWIKNQQKVIDFLSLGEQVQTHGNPKFVPNSAKVKIIPSHYAENLINIYKKLPDTVEVNGTELQPLVAVSPALMESCTRVYIDDREI